MSMTHSITLLGCGKLAKTLGRLWQEYKTFEIIQLWSRTFANAEATGKFIGAGTAVAALEQLGPADVWLIATADGYISTLARQLAVSGLLRNGDVVFHCSGALGSEVLLPARECGAVVASVHPVHSFADPGRSVDGFAGSYCAAEGDAAALAVLQPAFEAVGGNVFQIVASAKTLYHAGSVMACNYLVGLMEASLRSFEYAGIDRHLAAAFLQPIVHSTVDNALAGGTVNALTGPIARGDFHTVQQQLEKIQAVDASLSLLYRVLGRQALTLARQQQAVDAAQLDKIEALLSGEGCGF